MLVEGFKYTCIFLEHTSFNPTCKIIGLCRKKDPIYTAWLNAMQLEDEFFSSHVFCVILRQTIYKI